MRDRDGAVAAVTEMEQSAEPATGIHRRPSAEDLAALAQPLKQPLVQPLTLCGHGTRVYARGLCRSCHRKLHGEGLPLPPRRSRWDNYDALTAWIRTLPDDVRARMLVALQEAT